MALDLRVLRMKRAILILVFVFGLFFVGIVHADSVVGWGDNRNGQASPPAGNNYVAIARTK